MSLELAMEAFPKAGAKDGFAMLCFGFDGSSSS
jgi:hypothetical protein